MMRFLKKKKKCPLFILAPFQKPPPSNYVKQITRFSSEVRYFRVNYFSVEACQMFILLFYVRVVKHNRENVREPGGESLRLCII